jgi:hypothetical protein
LAKARRCPTAQDITRAQGLKPNPLPRMNTDQERRAIRFLANLIFVNPLAGPTLVDPTFVNPRRDRDGQKNAWSLETAFVKMYQFALDSLMKQPYTLAAPQGVNGIDI